MFSEEVNNGVFRTLVFSEEVSNYVLRRTE